MNNTRILATGPDFLNIGVRGTGPVIEELIEGAETEIQIMAYVISSHAKTFLNGIENALRRGVKVTIILNKLEEHDKAMRKKMSEMIMQHPALKVLDFTDSSGGNLHTKVIIVDRNRAVIGSANFSWHGMTKNYEIGVELEGDVVWDLAKMADRLEEKLDGRGF